MIGTVSISGQLFLGVFPKESLIDNKYMIGNLIFGCLSSVWVYCIETDVRAVGMS